MRRDVVQYGLVISNLATTIKDQRIEIKRVARALLGYFPTNKPMKTEASDSDNDSIDEPATADTATDDIATDGSTNGFD